MESETADSTGTAGTTPPAGVVAAPAQAPWSARRTAARPEPAPLDAKAELARIRAAAGLPERLDAATAAKVSALLWPQRASVLGAVPVPSAQAAA